MVDDSLIYLGVGIAALVLLTKGKVGSYVGESVGYATGSTFSGLVTGAIEGLIIEPYNWATTYQGYIPIIDDLAKYAAKIKLLGNDEHWWY